MIARMTIMITASTISSTPDLRPVAASACATMSAIPATEVLGVAVDAASPAAPVGCPPPLPATRAGVAAAVGVASAVTVTCKVFEVTPAPVTDI
jgi:hypothetical protein